MRLLHGLLDLRVMQAGTDPLRSIGDAECKSGCFGYMFLQLREINFVECVRHGVIVDQVIRFLLLCHERWYAFQHEIEMVGAPFGGGDQFGRVKLLQRRNQIGCGIDYILASADRKASDLAGSRIEDNHSRGLIQFRAMRDGVGM